MKMMNEIQSKVTICAIIMLAVSIFFFVKFEGNNTYYFAVFLLTGAIVLFIWVESFSNIKPLKLSVILTSITVCVTILSMYIAHNLQITFKGGSNAIIGIITSQVVAGILNKNLKQIEKIFDKYFIK